MSGFVVVVVTGAVVDVEVEVDVDDVDVLAVVSSLSLPPATNTITRARITASNAALTIAHRFMMVPPVVTQNLLMRLSLQ
jgi:hypothetical protein